MLSRRRFVLGSLGIITLPEFFLPAEARKLVKKKPLPSGLRSLARQDWPPAILPDQVKFIDKGYSCFTDEFGRLAIVDLKKGDPKVIGALSGIGKKVMDLTIVGNRAYVLVFQENGSGEPQYMVLSISLTPASQPSILARMPVDLFIEANCLAVQQNLVCVGGTSNTGEYIVAAYNINNKGRTTELGHQSTMTVEQTIGKLDFDGKRLLVLQPGRTTVLDCFDLNDARSPEQKRQVKLAGEYRHLACAEGMAVLAGKSPQGFDLKLISMAPSPHAVSTLSLGNLRAVYDIAAQRSTFLVLGERDAQRIVMSVTADKQLQMTMDQSLSIPVSKAVSGNFARLSVKDNMANIVSGAAEVDVLNFDKLGWHHFYRYNIPRLTASGLVTWGNLAVVAAADLACYDISQPDNPVLKETVTPESTLKSVAAAGSFLLCLSKQSLSLRKMDSLGTVAASLKIDGQQLSYEPQHQVAYVLSKDEKKTILTPVSTFTNKLVVNPTLDLPADFRHISAGPGAIAVGGLSDVSLYDAKNNLSLLGSRHFETQAVRDIYLTNQYVVVTVVDHNSKGFLLILSREAQNNELPLLGTVDLPNDGAAVAVSEKQAVVVGRSTEGQDLLALVDIGSPGLPKVTGSMRVVEAASAIALRDHLAIVAGRGLEILALS